jgi:hypothetical protein
MLKQFAKWLFKVTHKHDMEVLIGWANYHKNQSENCLDYSGGIVNGIHNALISLFKINIK